MSDNPPTRGTKTYWRLVERGCGGHKIETMDGTEYDCRHKYPWICEQCPCQESFKKEEINEIN